MATLKEHQNAMVDLLANGSAIPASAARLAHALHDVLGLLLERDSEPHSSFNGGQTATADFINDNRLAADLGVFKDSILIGTLRAELANVTSQRNTYKARGESLEADADRVRDERDAYRKTAYEYLEQIEELKARIADIKSAV